MLERRNSDRIVLPKLIVREMNGDYLFHFTARNLSEGGVFLENKICSSTHEAFSKLSFTLSNGVLIPNVTARLVREETKSPRAGSAYEFLLVSEEARMELKRFFHANLLKGTA